MHLESARDKALSVVGDIVARRAIIHTSHDGKFATSINLVPLSLACKNGMVVPVPGVDMSWAIRHTENGEDRLMEANEILRLADKYFMSFAQLAEQMAHTPVNLTKAEEILAVTRGMTDRESKAQTAKREGILSLFNGGQRAANHESRFQTAWGLLNAGAELADHGAESRIRVTAGNDESTQRFKAAFGGSGRTLKMNLYDAIVQDRDLDLREFLKEMANRN